ncbi:MAG: IS200/IS605 family transposase [Saprospiraceae bacterium]|nr:IS200/IS605 family transposase [Saprospiraceae bacterium]
MANTYSQIYIQTVFIVQDRDCLLREAWREDLYKYITGIVQERGNKLIQIGGVEDHIHLFFGMKPAESVAELMKWVKGSSSEWINDHRFLKTKFMWQKGYGAFSYSQSHVDAVCRYIINQKEHHRKQTFMEEYTKLLDLFNIPFDERYVFKPVL